MMSRCRQRVGDLDSDQQSTLELERMAVHQLPHVATLDVLHRDEVVSFSLVEIKDGADVGMIER